VAAVEVEDVAVEAIAPAGIAEVRLAHLAEARLQADVRRIAWAGQGQLAHDHAASPASCLRS
jgi:hypothetical protein